MPTWSDLSWTFDVQLNEDPTWIPYTQPNFQDAHSGDEHIGVNQSTPRPDVAHELTTILDDALGPIRSHVGKELTGLRIKLWRSFDPEGDPDMIVEATSDQLDTGQVRDAFYDVEHAERALHQARYTLRHTLATSYAQGRPRRTPEEFLATLDPEVSHGLPDEDLAPMLRSTRIIYQVQQDLARAGHQTFNPGDAADEYHHDELPTGAVFFWAGLARMQVRADGTMTVQVDADSALWGFDLPAADPEVEKRAEQDRQAHRSQLATAMAEQLLPALTKRNLIACNDQDQIATVADLATGTILDLEQQGP